MTDSLYTGWGNRRRIKEALKQAVGNTALRKQSQNIQPKQAVLMREIHDLGLDTANGISKLSGMLASDILNSFSNAPSDVTSLKFYKHLQQCIYNVFVYEGHFTLPEVINTSVTRDTSEIWATEDSLNKVANFLTNFDQVTGDIAQLFRHFITPIVKHHPSILIPTTTQERTLSFDVPLMQVIQNLPQHLENMIHLCFVPEFEVLPSLEKTKQRLEYNVVIASGGSPTQHISELSKLKLPTNSDKEGEELLSSYLAGTVFEQLWQFEIPITIPQNTRFEHHHIVAGSGHGKTQTLQHLILHDLQQVARGGASVVVIDSQGDLINNIRNLAIFAEGQPLANRLIVIDPTDVEYPVSLNLFDVNMERINQYSQLDRERMTNGILELYDFVLGSLLGAEMTQKQSVIFRYITRLLLHIPNATIHTLRELLEEGGSLKYQEYINTLEGTARAFFQSEFDSKEFVQTKRQVVRRLWGILENQSFERMFSHPKNKLDLYSEMNSGKVILINTAKDLLKENGTEIFGRFFIAMIAQAAQERSVITKEKRLPTFVYIDEANDYFDRNIGIILSQARKYKIGMVIAGQFLGQMESKLQEAVFANTSIKFAGGVSAKDARTLANEMRTKSDFIESQDKLSFAAFIRGKTKSAVSISIEYGQMEAMLKMSNEQLQKQIQYMRDNFAVHYTHAGLHKEEYVDEAKGTDGPTSDEPMEWD